MNLNHRIIAVVGSNIQRVHCLTCGGDHKYYPPKGTQTDRSDRSHVKIARSVDKVSPSVRTSAARAAGEWQTIMREMNPDSVPRAYRVTESYAPAEFIEHPVFGLGRVVDIVGAERMQVIFKDGRKVLVCNKKSSA
jgi:hypothetical protein